MKKFILALDQGTTSSRAMLVDRDGQVGGLAQKLLSQKFPQPGWVEHDAIEIWESQLAVAHEVLHAQRLTPNDIVAIGIANQRETIILWDRASGLPVAPAIVWQDRRTSTSCDALRAAGHSHVIEQRTGLVVDAYFSATKLRWLLDNVPGARDKAVNGELAAGTVDSWLIFKLSGAHLTDTSNASRTMLMNLHSLQWDHEMLAMFDIPRSVLPEIVPSSALSCYTKISIFGSAIPIAGIAGDQQAATFGQTCFSPGMAKNTYGTGCFMLMPVGTTPMMSNNNLLATVGWTINSTPKFHAQYLLEGSVFMAGAIVQWLRDGLGIIESAEQSESLAMQVPDNGGVVFIPAFTGLGAPHWDAQARATIFGMSRGTTKAHLARAALESIAYQSTDLLIAMQKDSTITLQELRVDGGACRNNLLMQFQADMLAIPVVRPKVTETTALGAAYLAGLAVNFWQSTSELESHRHIDRCFLPSMDTAQRCEHMYWWHRALERSRSWIESNRSWPNSEQTVITHTTN
jgi:glycerol kinase